MQQTKNSFCHTDKGKGILVTTWDDRKGKKFPGSIQEIYFFRLGNWSYVVQKENSCISERWHKDTGKSPSMHSPVQKQLEQLAWCQAEWSVQQDEEKTAEARMRDILILPSKVVIPFCKLHLCLKPSPACWLFTLSIIAAAHRNCSL